MLKLLLYSALSVALALFILSTTSCEPGQYKDIRAALQNVASVSGTATVTMKDGSTMTFDLSQVDINTILGQLPKEGNTPKVVTGEAEGIIKTVSATAITVTAKKAEITLVINADTKIVSGDKTLAATDLKADQRVHVRYAADTKTALRIEVQGPAQEDRGNGKGDK